MLKMGVRTQKFVPRQREEQGGEEEQNVPRREGEQREEEEQKEGEKGDKKETDTKRNSGGGGRDKKGGKKKGKKKNDEKEGENAGIVQPLPPPPPPPPAPVEVTPTPNTTVMEGKMDGNGEGKRKKVGKKRKKQKGKVGTKGEAKGEKESGEKEKVVEQGKECPKLEENESSLKKGKDQENKKNVEQDKVKVQHNGRTAMEEESKGNATSKQPKKVENGKASYKNVKNGVRAMVERTNKILERSKNCKKTARKTSPVKPRLPLRTSARTAARKSSGDPMQGFLQAGVPLRTVELIKRPLELRDPATKLLFLASLSVYPKADPESDSTPIVIVNEEIPNINGTKPKIRSLELPLLPNWKGPNFSSSAKNATSLEEENLSLEVEQIVVSPKECKDGTGTVNTDKIGSQKSKTKTSPESKQPPVATVTPTPPMLKISPNINNKKDGCEDDEIIKPAGNNCKNTDDDKKTSTDVISTMEPQYPTIEGLVISPAKPKPAKKSGSNSSNIHVDTNTCILKSPVSRLEAIIAEAVGASTQKIADSQKPIKLPVPLALPSMTEIVKGAPSPAPSESNATGSGKGKRKSLEAIIQEIPKAKAQKSTMARDMNAVPHQTNPIFDRLLKNPVKKRPIKARKESLSAAQSHTSLLIIPSVSPQNPLSMSVPLQPAPGNSNIVPIVKDIVAGPPSKKAKLQNVSAVPMPLPIPLPPGLLNYAAMNGRLGETQERLKKSRKNKLAKTLCSVLPTGSPSNYQKLPVPFSKPAMPSSVSNIAASIRDTVGRSSEVSQAVNGVKTMSNMTIWSATTNDEQALDLCVKPQPINFDFKPRPKKGSQLNVSKSLLKPLNVEDDAPLDLVISRGPIPQGNRVIGNNRPRPPQHVSSEGEVETHQQPKQDLENVKQMLARLHTKIAPGVNGVHIISLE